MSSRDELVHLLKWHDAAEMERLLGLSACQRFEEIKILLRMCELVGGVERQAAALAALVDEISAIGPERDDRLRSPVLRGWLNSFGRIHDWTDVSNPALLRRLDMTENMRVSLSHGQEWSAVMAIEHGVLMTWHCELAIGGLDGELVGARKEGSHLILVDQYGQRTNYDLESHDDPRILRSPCLPGTEIAVRNDLPWLRLKLREGSIPTREEGIVHDVYDNSAPYHLSTDLTPILQAGETLSRAWPEAYDEFRRDLRIIIPRTVPPGWTVGGFTVSSHQGALWMPSTDPVDIIDHAVHEHAHVKLRYLEEAYPILAPGEDQRTFSVPWRDDPRPLVGIMEGIYVHLRSAEALRRAEGIGALNSEQASRALPRAEELQRQVTEGVRIFAENARLTEAGMGFVAWAQETSTMAFA